MAGGGAGVSSWRKNAVFLVALLLVLPVALQTAYEWLIQWLLPLLPAALVIIGLLLLLGGLLTFWQRRSGG